MLKQQRINQFPIALLVITCLSVIILFGCSQQEKKTSEPSTEQSETQETVIKPVQETEKTEPEPEAKPMVEPANAIAVIETAKGNIEFEFYADDSPQASKNFIKNASTGYYRSEKFHRVEPLLIQGGSSITDESFPIEKSDLPLEKGSVVMVTEEGSDVADGDEFLICKDAIVNEGWTVLGKVTKGLEVLDKIVKNDKIVDITIRERNTE
jgi:cyclophilin family peptidyl-prolyl cis-trans isomerase